MKGMGLETYSISSNVYLYATLYVIISYRYPKNTLYNVIYSQVAGAGLDFLNLYPRVSGHNLQTQHCKFLTKI